MQLIKCRRFLIFIFRRLLAFIFRRFLMFICRRLDQLDTEVPARMPATKVVHCPCG